MARADLIVRLVRSASRGDHPVFRKAVEALIAEERAMQHHLFADRLEESLRTNGTGPAPPGLHKLAEPTSQQVMEVVPERRLEDLVLPAEVEKAMAEVIEEQHRAELLRSHNLEPRHRLLLVGPPGNGKTSLAEALATALMVPLYVVRYEAVVASYLGETSTRLARLFDFVRNRHCVLFFDEFDTVGKERGDEHETGEIKRVVSNLLLQIDRLPSYVVVVAATNHGELLDRAVWRRFQLRLQLPPPSTQAIEKWLRAFCTRTGLCLGKSPATLAKQLRGGSFGEIEDLALDIKRRMVLMAPAGGPEKIVAERLKQWRARYAPTVAEEEKP